MSFISIQNFLEPFRRKVHLISICMIAVLFLIFRLHGGGMTLERVGTEDRPSSSLFDRSERSVERAAPTQRPSSPVLDDIVSPRRPPKEPTDKQPRRDSAPERSGLDDIERSLGLR